MRNVVLLVSVSLLLGFQLQAKEIELECVLKVELGQPIGQLRAVPVSLGGDRPKAFLTIYSEDPEVDPYIGMFFFPKSTLRMQLFTEDGTVLWEQDLGTGVVPGIWFCPIFAFDLDHDSVDEIWFVGNKDPEHPMDYRSYVLKRLDAETGKTTGMWPWPTVTESTTMSHRYRNFILGGFVHDQPVLITAQGTYHQMALQCWNSDMSKRWEVLLDPSVDGGTLGSHVCPVVDIDANGIDEVLWGERCIELDAGRQLFCAGPPSWSGHSDIVQPVLDRKTGKWFIHTCRESSPNVGPRIVCFDDSGQQLWAKLEEGHIDTGWAAHLGPRGEAIVLGVKVGEKVRDAKGERRLWTESYTYDVLTGNPFEMNIDPYTTIPVDLNGDGRHELVKGYFEGDGTVYDGNGKEIGNIGGLAAMCSKFTRHAGEQILSFSRDGVLRIWADRNAEDTPVAQRRYKSKYYYTNQRMTACGYNLFSLGGL